MEPVEVFLHIILSAGYVVLPCLPAAPITLWIRYCWRNLDVTQRMIEWERLPSDIQRCNFWEDDYGTL